MRENWLSNRIFLSYDDIVDLCCEAWNKIAQTAMAHNANRSQTMDI
ncbi:uncharacterized protein y4pE/y4sA [Asticcacaulis biprosthecium C19]|uniref:Uncharacterized protein y4pE/y4sA n=1 Tax=Asticcacaulis biprosthecium C19 TaxID=715226 RepID=F4QFY1_9CAUL|nr:uncharacterized protein y4pE/y4sA [Asticcacaulis biprosthecium C19]